MDSEKILREAKKNSAKNEFIRVRVDSDTKNKINNIARVYNTTESQILLGLINEFLNDYKNNHPLTEVIEYHED